MSTGFYLIFPFFFFNDTATTEIYTLSLHDALPICVRVGEREGQRRDAIDGHRIRREGFGDRRLHRGRAAGEEHVVVRSEEHTSELQSRQYLVCRLLLEKKNSRSHLLLLSAIATSTS